MSSAKTETQARTAGSPQTDDLSGRQQLRGNYFDVESANTIAEKLYRLYHQKETGALEQNEMKAMISDAYGVFNRTYTPTIGDEQSFVEAHDQDRDGKVTLEDLKSICLSYLCKPLGAADNSTPKPAQPHQNLQNGQNKFLNSQHTFGEYNSSNANNSQREVVTANAYQSNQQN